MITTKKDLIDIFYKLGLRSNIHVMVHSSLSSLGYVVNGAEDVIGALLEVIGKNGTLMMPAHTGQLTDPADWKNPSIEPDQINIVRENLKPFWKYTPIRNRGIIPETFLTYISIRRSKHPLNSVIAQGFYADYFTREHLLHESEGLKSPIGKFYNSRGYILLLGVTLARCTAIHLAEFIADVPYLKQSNVKVLTGANEFTRLEKYPSNSEYFDKVRKDAPDLFTVLPFRNSELIFFPIHPVVDFVVSKLCEDEMYLMKP